jgi:hypothetical protein
MAPWPQMPWLEQAKASSLAEFRDFAAGLCRDERAVRAVIAESEATGKRSDRRRS